MGFGLINLPAIVIVSTYFNKKRAFASSMASCGSGVGTLIMAPIISTLDTNFGWGYTMMMIGALMLACVPLGFLFKPIATNEPEKATAKNDEKSLRMKKEIKDSDSTDEEITGCCPLFLKTSIPKYPIIMHDAVFATCLLSNFLTNIGFAVPYVYTVVSTILLNFLTQLQHHTNNSLRIVQCRWESENMMQVTSSL